MLSLSYSNIRSRRPFAFWRRDLLGVLRARGLRQEVSAEE
jgi:hypothetical protein